VRKARFSKNMTVPALIVAAVIVVIVVALVIGEDKSKPPSRTDIANSACGPYRDDKNVTIGKQTIKAEVPRTAAAQAKGLGGRPCILPNQGMLFVFSKAGQYAFWMKDMRFPIDILWINPDHKVVGQEIDVEPNTYPDRFVNKPENPAQYVLELKSERSRELGVNLGTPVSIE